jgi:uncharacterized paraquat-inducible protein A
MASSCGCHHPYIVWNSTFQKNICSTCKAIEQIIETIYCPSCKIRTVSFTKYNTNFYQCNTCQTAVFNNTAMIKTERRWVMERLRDKSGMCQQRDSGEECG